MPKIAFYTLGCKSNQYETDSMAKAAASSGFEIVPYPAKADIYVINTCTVTANADKKSRHAIRYAKKVNPSAKVIATGCYVETDNFSMKEANFILLNKDKLKIAEVIRDGRCETRDANLISSPSSHLPSRVRSNLMIENGCNNFCSYCIVPFVRGKIISKPFDEVIAEAKSMAKDGVKEIILTGINLGEYRSDFPTSISHLSSLISNSASPTSHLASLLNELSTIDGLLRIRLSSIEPMYVTDDLIKVIKENPKVCKHLHIPMQSGDDGILKAMNRNYTSKDFLNLINKIKKQVKDIAITSDVIVGFPGEDENAFKNTCRLVDKIKFSRIHVFSYSDRPGTAASKLPNKIKPKVIDARYQIIDKLRIKYMLKFHRSFLRKPVDVLIEQKDSKTLMYEGLTSNYIRVFLRAPLSEAGPSRRDDKCIGRLIPAKFKSFQGENVIATPILV